MMDEWGQLERAVEARCSKALKNMGLLLRKSRKRKNFTVDDLGGFMIVDQAGNYVVAGSKYDMTLSDVLHWLSEAERDGKI